jgi:hypothetical protein
MSLGIILALGGAALTIDIGHLVTVQGELQRAADAGALAGARSLWPRILPILTNPPTDPDCALARTWATNSASNENNKVNGSTLASYEIEVLVGRWDYATKQFAEGCFRANAVKVRVRKDGIPMLMAGIFGITSGNLAATSIAIIDWVKAVGKGTLPIAINKQYVIPGQIIKINFTPDPDENGGWFADPPDKANSATFKDYVVNRSCPPLHIGDVINLQNGKDASVIKALGEKLAEYHQNNSNYDTFLPVVETNLFNQSQPIVAFVPFRILEVNGNKGVTGQVLGLAKCNAAMPGGEAGYGALAPAKLVN